MTLPCLDQFAVRIVPNVAISVDVIPEVSRGDSTLIACDAIGVMAYRRPGYQYITREEAKRNITMRQSVPVDVLRMQNDVLHIGHT